MNQKLNRRQFIKTGSMGLAATCLIPKFLSASDAGFNPFSNQPLDMTYDAISSHFQVSEAMMRELISIALSKGGDYCDLYFEHKIYNNIGLEDNLVNRAYSGIDYGVGIRVLKGDQTGYCFTEDLSPEAMRSAARTAANIANAASSYQAVNLQALQHPNYYKIKSSWDEVGIEQKIPLLQKANEKILSLDKRIIKSSAFFSDETKYVLFVNSEGRTFADYQPMGTIYTSCTAEQNGKKERNGYSISLRKGSEYFDEKTIHRAAKETVEKTITLFDAQPAAAGEMEVVLAAGGSGILLHEAIGHGMEADFNRKEVSIFSDKLGKKVAEPFVTIVDSGVLPNERGTINIDDEGNDSQETVLVEGGIMKSYMHDRLSAQFYKTKPTGNGRRQSFRFAPMPRMRSTFMRPGPHKKEDIISSVKNGIMALDFTNGQVQIGAGDFTFYVKLGYLIENGKITRPIKDINIIGNGPDVLSKVTMVADDLEISEGSWTCGKDGQSVPVSQGLPTIKVSKITVGGSK